MAKKRRDTFRLGLAVIVIFSLFVGVLLFIGGGWKRDPRVPFVVRFRHTLTLPLLEEDAEIIGFGLVVGKVKELSEVEDVDPEKASAGPTLFLEIHGEINESVGLRQDCRIVAEGPPLGGRGYLRVVNRGASPERIDPGRPVYGGTSGFAAALDAISAELDEKNPDGILWYVKHQLDPDSAESVIAKLHRSLDDVNALTLAIALQTDARRKDAVIAKMNMVLDNLNLTTGYVRDQVTPGHEDMALAKIHEALDSLNSGLAEVAAMLQENRPHVTGAMRSIERTAATLDTGIAAPIAGELDKSNPQSILGRVHTSFERVIQSLEDLNLVTDKTKRLVVLNSERFSGLIENVKEASDHLKATSKDLRRNPWRLLYRPSLEETKELNIFDAAREFAEAAGRLDDSATQLRALLESREGAVPADDADLAKIRAHLQETFEKFQAAEKSLWQQLGTP